MVLILEARALEPTSMASALPQSWACSRSLKLMGSRNTREVSNLPLQTNPLSYSEGAPGGRSSNLAG